MTAARRADGLLALAGGGIVLLLLVGLLLHRPGAENVGSVVLVDLFVVVTGAAALLFLFASALVLRQGGGRSTLALVLVVAALMRIGPLLAPPFLSSDLYRYVWDGRVQRAGINPYRFIPADPALAPLRDRAIYPHINRRDYAPTIYPPAAQLLFRFVAGISQTPLAIKLAAVLLEALAIGCLVALLRGIGQPPSRVLLYAWNPLAAWCFAGNGHVDAAAIGLVALALLLRVRGCDGWCGVALGAAVLVKFLPAAIVPAFWRGRWRFPVVLVVTMVLLYLPFVGVGPRRMFGFLGSYGGEEGLTDGRGVWILAGLARMGHASPAILHAYLAIAVLFLGLLALAAGLVRRPPGAAGDSVALGARAGCLAAATFLVLSPHYPWYFPWFGVFAVLAPARSVLWLSVAPVLLYVDPFNEFFVWPSLVYGPALLLFVMDLRRGPLPFGAVPVSMSLSTRTLPA